MCDALDFPRNQPLLGPVTYYAAEALADTMRASENPHRSPKLKPKEVTPCFIVAGGSVLETLLGCLTASRPYEEMITARLRGGDAVLLTSAPMCSIVGEDLDERFRPNSNLWEDAMKRDDWTIVRHLRGDGTGQPVELGGKPKVEAEEKKGWNSATLTEQWNRYAGNTLILSDSEYLEIRKRAGFGQETGKAIPLEIMATLKPLVKDYVIADNDPYCMAAFQEIHHHGHGHGRHSKHDHGHGRKSKKKTMAGAMLNAVKGSGDPGSIKRSNTSKVHH